LSEVWLLNFLRWSWYHHDIELILSISTNPQWQSQQSPHISGSEAWKPCARPTSAEKCSISFRSRWCRLEFLWPRFSETLWFALVLCCF
jgi:hypothetical protein